jgi:hypothetical protein
MPQDQIVDEVVVGGPRPNSANAGRRNSGMVTEYIDGSGKAARVERGGNGIEADDIHEGGRKQTALKPSTQKLLDILDKQDAVEPENEASADTDDAGLVDAKPAAEGGEDVVEEKHPAFDEIVAERDRYADHNRQLLDALDEAQRRPRSEPSEREKALDEVERTYGDDSIGAVRKLIATVLGVAHDSADVDRELAGLYADLTSQQLKVPLEESHKAKREVERARQALARDKRERKAEIDAASNRGNQDAEARQFEEVGTFIDGRINSKGATGKSIADDHPLLMSFAEELDGMKASHLLGKVVQREIKAGTLDPTKMTDDQMLAKAAKLVEAHYQSLGDRFAATRPTTPNPTDTAKTETTAANASQAKRQSPGARTITNATASVAPATSPTKKAPAKTEERLVFKTNKERQDHALRHIPS